MSKPGWMAEVIKMEIYIIKVTTTEEQKITQKINRLSHPAIKKAYCPESVLYKPVFPGYIFIDMNLTSSAYYKILEIPGVLYFLSPTYGIYPLDKKDTFRLDQKTPSLIGLPVTITRGRYRGIAGIVKNISFPIVTVTLPLGVNTNLNIKSLILIEDQAVSHGSVVKIISGTYSGLTGTILNMENSTATINVDIFGTETSIKCPVNNLEVISCLQEHFVK